MNTHPIRRTALGLAATLLAAGTALAGGQQIAAEVATDGKAILVHTYHCGTPAAIKLTGTAVGLVNGERRQIPLAITRTADLAVFSVARQWPSEGAWVLTLTGAGERSVSSLVELASGSQLKIVSQSSRYEPAPEREISAALTRLAQK
jgi:hypothetical protein